MDVLSALMTVRSRVTRTMNTSFSHLQRLGMVEERRRHQPEDQ